MYRSFFCRLCRKKGVKVVHSEPSKQQQIFSTFNLHKYFGVFPSPKLSQLPFPFRSSAAVRRNGTKSCRRRVGGFINYVMRHLEPNVSLQNATRTLESFFFLQNEKFIVGKKTTSQTRKRLREILFLGRTAFHVYFGVTQWLLYTFLPHFSPTHVFPNSESPEKEKFLDPKAKRSRRS